MADDVAHRIAEYLAERAILLSVDDVAGLRALLASALTPEERATVERIGGKGDRLSVDALELLAIIDRLAPVQR